MKILYVITHMPCPPYMGVHHRVFNVGRQLKKCGDVTVVYVGGSFNSERLAATEKEFETLLAKLNLKPQDLLRKGEKVYKEKFKGLTLNDHEWIKVMLENPKLIERPIIVKGNKAIIGRPPVLVKDLF